MMAPTCPECWGGRPRRHGEPMTLADPASWPAPSTRSMRQTARYGRAEALSWDRMHPRLTHRGGWAAHPGPLPIVEGTLIRLAVEHLPGARAAKPIWLWTSVLGADAESVIPLLAGLPAPLRPGTHHPLRQAGPGLDPPEGALPGRGRPLDLADPRRAHPAATGPPTRSRSAPALGTATASRAADPSEGPLGISLPTREDPVSGPGAKTRPSWAPDAHPGSPTGTALPVTASASPAPRPHPPPQRRSRVKRQDQAAARNRLARGWPTGSPIRR